MKKLKEIESSGAKGKINFVILAAQQSICIKYYVIMYNSIVNSTVGMDFAKWEAEISVA